MNLFDLPPLLIGLLLVILFYSLGMSGRAYDGEDVEDAMQDRAARKATSKKPTRGQLLRTLASRAARRATLRESAQDWTAAAAPSPEERVAARELLERVERVLHNLEPHLFKQLAMVAAGYTYSEVAAEFGGTGEAVRKRLEREVARLRKLPEFADLQV